MRQPAITGFFRGALAAFILALAGCQLTQTWPSMQQQLVSLRPGDLEASGLAFITPSTVTGQEQEKQAVALTFAQVIKDERPGLRVVTLAETLGAINKAGALDDQADATTTAMTRDYGARSCACGGGRGDRHPYLAQLKQGFVRVQERAGFGFRIVETSMPMSGCSSRSGTPATARSRGKRCRRCESRTRR
jgi:hypothetical protein